MIAPSGERVTYRYDEAGNLLSVTDLNAATRNWYGYSETLPHHVAVVVTPEASGSVLPQNGAS